MMCPCYVRASGDGSRHVPLELRCFDGLAHTVAAPWSVLRRQRSEVRILLGAPAIQRDLSESPSALPPFVHAMSAQGIEAREDRNNADWSGLREPGRQRRCAHNQSPFGHIERN